MTGLQVWLHPSSRTIGLLAHSCSLLAKGLRAKSQERS
jgi:hypothetical protein